jgi:hypothetical protein
LVRKARVGLITQNARSSESSCERFSFGTV